MNCDGVRGLLSAYLDGELSPGELLRVERHLSRCPMCADEVDSLRQTIALVASLDEVEVPPSFHTRLHERLAAADPPAVRGRRRTGTGGWQRYAFRWVVPAAAAAAAFAIGLTALPQARNLAGLEGPVGSFLVPGRGPDSGTVAVVGVEQSPSANTTGGKSGPVTHPGEGAPDPSGGNQVAGRDPGTEPTGQGTGSGGNPGAAVGSQGDAHVVSVDPGSSTRPEDLEPLYSYSIVLTAAGVSQEDLVLALQAFGPRAETDSILVTVPAAQRSAVVAAIKAIPGVELPAEPTEAAIDLAPQIYDITTQLEADQQQLADLRDQMAALDDPEALADARGLQDALEERIAESSQALARIQGQVNTALITVKLQATVQ